MKIILPKSSEIKCGNEGVGSIQRAVIGAWLGTGDHSSSLKVSDDLKIGHHNAQLRQIRNALRIGNNASWRSL
jgi:hypothetical protein